MVQGLTFVPVLKHLLLHSKRKTQRKSCFTTKLFLKHETELWGQIVCIYFRALKIVLGVRDNSPKKVLSVLNLLKRDHLFRLQVRKNSSVCLKLPLFRTTLKLTISWTWVRFKQALNTSLIPHWFSSSALVRILNIFTTDKIVQTFEVSSCKQNPR